MADPKKQTPAEAATMWGSIATAAEGIVDSGVTVAGMYSPKVREHELAMAQLNAQTAASNAEAAKNSPGGSFLGGIDTKYLWIGGAVLVLAILLFLMTKK